MRRCYKLFPEDIERIREQALFGARNCDQARAWGVSESSTHAVRRNFEPQPAPETEEVVTYPNPPLFEQLQAFGRLPRFA